MRDMTYADVLRALEARKGDGDWRRIAEHAGVHYDTVARIARGAIKSPSVQLVEKLAAALESIPPEGAPDEAKAAA